MDNCALIPYFTHSTINVHSHSLYLPYICNVYLNLHPVGKIMNWYISKLDHIML